jgi:hypothetical protein
MMGGSGSMQLHPRDMGTRVLIYLALVAAAMLAAGCAPPSTSSPSSTPTRPPDYVGELIRAVERGSVKIVVEPSILAASTAEADFDPTEPVLVALVNGEERAYSVAQMGIHEVVNDTLGGVPIAVTW